MTILPLSTVVKRNVKNLQLKPILTTEGTSTVQGANAISIQRLNSVSVVALF